MHNKSIAIAIMIFVLIIIGMFVFAYIKRTELQTPIVEEPVTDDNALDPYAYIDRIDAKHFYINGVHTIAGEVNLPTPCDLLNWNSTIAESMPEQVTVAFSVLNEAEMCAQVLTTARFKESFTASERAQIRATFNGREIPLNLIPAAEGETPEEFELFIKG